MLIGGKALPELAERHEGRYGPEREDVFAAKNYELSHMQTDSNSVPMLCKHEVVGSITADSTISDRRVSCFA